MNISYLFQKEIPLIDPHGYSPISIVSHAHSDHLAMNPYGKQRTIICSKETALLAEKRLGEKINFIILDYGKKTKLNNLFKSFNFEKDIYITLYPSGHILGASQILIESKYISLLYSGDFKLRENKSCLCLQYPKTENQIDFLIMESTFGKEKYIFPNYEVLKNEIIKFCKDSQMNGYVPVLLGYSLGKSQEILKILEDFNFNVLLHGSVFNITKIYESFNISFGNYAKYEKNLLSENKSVLIVPPHLLKSTMLRNIPNITTAIATGWAIDSSVKYIYKTDNFFPLSDHADYNELIEYAKNINPKKVLVTHGFVKDLSKALNKEGLNAEPLDTYNIHSLF